MDLKGSKTEQNLLKTFAGESRARNKYNFYAEKARLEGLNAIAEVWDATANNEKAHAREVFVRFLKLMGTTKENLIESSEGEALESQKMYKEFEKVAREEGFVEIADFYKELSEVEESHMDRFRAWVRYLDGAQISKDNMWKCTNCGYIHIGEKPPMACPLCKYPRGYFEPYCNPYK